MKILLRLAKEAHQYKWYQVLAIFCTILITLISLAAPKLLSNMTAIVSKGVDAAGLHQIYRIAVILLILYLVRILLRFLASYVAHIAGWTMIQILRVRLYKKLQTFSSDFYHERQIGDLMSRVIEDTNTFEQLYCHIIPESVTNIITIVGVCVILILTNWRLGLLTLIPVPFILYASWLYVHKVRPNFKIAQKAQGDFSAQLQDNFSGMKETQAFGQEEREAEIIEEKASLITKYRLRALKMLFIYFPSVEFLTSAGTLIVVACGGYFAWRGWINAADIVSFLLYLSLFYTPITNIAQQLEGAQTALAGAERVIEILDTPESIKNNPGAVDIGRVEGSIRFDHVSFHYPDTPEVSVLKDISLEIKPGQMAAIVGATGVGKTTLTQLLSRFYDPTDGRILLDEHDIRKITVESLRRNIAPVLQDTFLFNGTISENISFAHPDSSEEDVEKAARAACIYDDIMAMPNGFQTIVGERGTRLSGGQKQRIAIARAVLTNAPIMVLDEATASVDVETEAHIQNAINDLAGKKTILVIAHRLSTVRKADVIFVFQNGQIVQQGNHETLVAQPGIYRDMCLMQDNPTPENRAVC